MLLRRMSGQEPNSPSFVSVLPMNPQHLDIDLGPDRSRTQSVTLWSMLLQPQSNTVCARRCEVDLRDGGHGQKGPEWTFVRNYGVSVTDRMCVCIRNYGVRTYAIRTTLIVVHTEVQSRHVHINTRNGRRRESCSRNLSLRGA